MITERQIIRLTYIKKSGGGYDGKPSIFDNIKQEDVIMAFFPCTRFEAQILLSFRGEAHQMKGYTDIEKLEKDLWLHQGLSENYELITKLAIIVLKRGLRMVFENPHGSQHYLTRYWCLKPSIVDTNRRLSGDYMTKPTQYWFIGFEPQDNLVFEPIEYVEYRTHQGMTAKDGKSKTVRRSEIHPQYASRFIRQYIIDGKELDEFGKIKTTTTDTEDETNGIH